MNFPNSLNTSVILVGAFVCLHFFEMGVDKKYNAYNSALSDITKEKKWEFEHLTSSVISSDQKSLKEEEKINALRTDMKLLDDLLASRMSLKLNASKKLLEKYEIDEDDFKYRGGLSEHDQYLIVNEVNNQLRAICSKVYFRKQQARLSNMHLIIMDRLKSYSLNQIYDLEFQMVDLYKSFPSDGLIVKIDGIENRNVDFPIEIGFKPDSISFQVELENRVTGETQKINEIYFP